MAPAPSERRTVAVLFSDLSGFTRMAQRMDPEEVQELVDALFGRLRVEIERHGGTVDKFIGDAVMAVFGAPVAHGDDAGRAVRAGLAMQGATAGFARDRGLDLRLRIGINLGEVMWGAVGGAAPTVMGDAVNLAQRLESAAAPGTVLVSRAVERAARRDARFRPVGPLEVKGRDEAVEAFEAEAALPGRTEYRGVPGVASQMVGRAEELARLLAPVEAGRGGSFVVQGDAGIGKSRLLAELRRAVRGRVPDAWVAVGRAHEGVPVPLGAFGEIAREGLAVGADLAGSLRGTLARAPGASPADCENAADLILLSLGHPRPDSRVSAMDPERRRAETFQAWRRWIAACAGGRTAVLCIEDLHWADGLTRDLLQDLAARPPAGRLILVAATRPGPPLPSGCEPLVLQELALPALRDLAAAILEAPPDDALARFLAEQTGGHPYYVEELCHWLRDHGRVSGSPASLAPAAAGIPEGLLGLLTARLDALPPRDKQTLKTASVLGRVFWPALLGESPDALDLAVRERLVQASDGSAFPGEREFTFRHALIRDAAYALVPRRERARLHGTFAELLEGRAAGAGRRAIVMAATQREAAGQPAEAARLWLQAAREANDEANPREGLAHAEAAIRAGGGSPARLAAVVARVKLGLNAEALRSAGELSDDPDVAIRTEARLAMATSLERLGRAEEAVAATEAASREAPTPEFRWKAVMGRGYALHSAGRWHDAAAAAEEVVAALAGEESRPSTALGRILAGALGLVAGASWNLGDYARAADAARRAVALRRASGDRGGLARSLASHGAMHAMTGRIPEGVALLSEALEIQRDIGDRTGEVTTLASIADARLRQNDCAAAREAANASFAIAVEVGDPAGRAIACTLRARSCLADGDYENGLPAAREAVLESAGDNLRFHEAIARLALSEALRATGRREESVECLRLALGITQKIGHRWNELDIRGALGAELSFLGRLEEAFEVLDAAVDLAVAWGHGDQEANLRLIRHDARRRAGLPPGEDAAAALRLGESTGSPALQREALAQLALDASRAGRRDDASAAAARAESFAPDRATASVRFTDFLNRARMQAILGHAPGARAALDAAAASLQPCALGLRAELEEAKGEVERELGRGASRG